MQTHVQSLSICLLLVAHRVSSASTCWHPDGENIADFDVPCDPFADVSPCCGSASYCMDNGLCYDSGSISRGSCTDKTWGDGCPQYCYNSRSPRCWLQPRRPTNSACLTVPGSCDDSQGCTVIVCDAWSRNFTCGYPNNCLTGENTFSMSGGQAIVLRPTQVALLQPDESPAAITLPPSGILSVDPTLREAQTQPAFASSSARAPSMTSSAASAASATSSSSTASCSPPQAQQFSAGQVAGASAGTGIPLLCALAAAAFIIFRQRKQIRDGRKHAEQGAAVERREPQTAEPGGTSSSTWCEQQRPSQAWSASTQMSPAALHRPNEMEALYAQKAEMSTDQDPRELDNAGR